MRRKDIDWLRIFAIFLLFPFHTARVFDSSEANYIENAVTSRAGEIFMNVIWPWFMPLLFLVAGISAYYALQKRSGKEFAIERVMRLLVPLVLGIILIVPIQGYLARLQEGTLHGGYWSFLFTQFFPNFSDLSGYHGTFTPGHLWFIMYLFVISMAVLPILTGTLKRRKGKGIGAFGRLFEREWFLVLLFIPLLSFEALPDIAGKNPFYYALYYLIGFFIASNDASWKAIDRVKWLSAALVAFSVPLFLVSQNLSYGTSDFSWQSILHGLFRNLYGWSALLTMLAFARMFLNRGGRVLDYLSQAAFPVYVLHQSVMMVVAYFVVQWNMGVPGKYWLILFTTLIASFALYEISRYIPPLRVVLGIKKARPKPVSVRTT
jgi:glucans biosynthesis protein C